MNNETSTFSKRVRALSAVLGAALLLAGCSGGLLSASSWPGLSASGSTAYIAYNQSVTAVDLDTGRVQWTFPQEPERDQTFFAPPALSQGGLVIVGGYDNVVYALDKTSGQERWSVSLDHSEERIIGAPLIAEDRVYVPSSSNRLYALSLEDGGQLWPEPFTAEEDLWAPPLISGETLYVACLDHILYALEAKSGALQWRRDLGGAMADRPTLVDGMLLVGTFTNELLALDAADGSERWSFETDDSVWSAPAVNGDLAYFGDVSGTAHAVEIQSGREAWRASLDGAIAARPLIAGDSVYFVTEAGKVYALEAASGRPVWPGETQLDGRLLSDPARVDDALLVASIGTECLLYTVEMGSGANRCLFQPEGYGDTRCLTPISSHP